MASENGDPFDGGSPPALRAENDDNYEDLLGTQMPTDGPEMSMSHLQDPVSKPQPSGDNREVKIKTEEETDTDFLWAAMQEHTIKLTDSELDSDEDNQSHSEEATLTTSGRSRALLADSTADSEDNTSSLENSNRRTSARPRAQDAGVYIKQESPEYEAMSDEFIQGQVIDLSDTNEDIANSSKGTYKHGTTMPNGTILLSDGEDQQEEIIVYDDGSTSVTIKQENPDVEFMGANKGLIDLSESEGEPATAPKPNLGRSFQKTPNPRARRTPADIEKMTRMQRMYAERALANRVPTGAINLFSLPSGARTPHPTRDSDDSDSWMSGTVIEEERPAGHFAKSKRIYKAKRKARKNTLEDDLKFQKADQEEKVRLKRLEPAYIRDRGSHSDANDEAEESDEGLFVPEGTPTPSTSKKRFGTTVDDEDSNDAAPKEKASPRKRKSKDTGKRTRAELNNELVNNMLAGMESELAKQKKRSKTSEKVTVEPRKSKKKTSQKNADNEPKGKGKAKKPMKRPRPTQAGYMNDAASLMTSNVYEDANANLGKEAMPTMTDKRKHQAMASLTASIPLEDAAKAKSEKQHILRMTTLLGSVKASGNGKGWNMKGMTQVLHHHQIQGAGTMKERETGVDMPQSGILADEMGFGKTVMMIATIISNPPSPFEEHKSTLIVCSPALISQWDDEIAKHTKDGIFKNDIMRHHGAYKLSTKGASGRGAVAKMQRADIVLTTYSEVIKSYPKYQVPDDIVDPDEKKQWWLNEWERSRDILHRVQFYRVVLDEAQVIKNHQSQTSIACRSLMAKHRWAISGTPILNEIEELYPYFKFLRIPHTGSYPVFKQNFCIKGSNVCNQRLHSFLDRILIRRTYKSQLFERPIIEMPANHQETITLEFNSVERKIYEIIHGRFIRAINKASAEGTLEKGSRLVLSMLLRLRQMTAHVFMLQETMEELFEFEDIEALWTETSSEVLADVDSSRDMMKSMRKMIAAKDDPAEEPLDDDDAGQGDTEQGSALIFKFRKYLRQLKSGSKWLELKDRSLCHKCKGPPDDPWITSCMHMYCNECLLSMAHDAAVADQDSATCIVCNEVFKESHPCGGLQELEVEEYPTPPPQDGKPKVRPKRKAKDNMEWVNFDGQILPSTKTAAVQAQIEKWLRDEPKKKIIVFSQFHLVMQVLGKYHGKMSHKAREESIEQFRKDPEKIVMIASLKCGGIGLNLTMASKVICVDLWFNSLVEQQGMQGFSFCRVFRIGQTEETYLSRFVIKDTVDARLLKMQKRKDKIIEAAMDDRTVLSKLTLEDMMHLFGDVVHDENAKPFIFTEDDPEMASMAPAMPREEEEDPVAWNT